LFDLQLLAEHVVVRLVAVLLGPGDTLAHVAEGLADKDVPRPAAAHREQAEQDEGHSSFPRVHSTDAPMRIFRRVACRKGLGACYRGVTTVSRLPKPPLRSLCPERERINPRPRSSRTAASSSRPIVSARSWAGSACSPPAPAA